MKTTLQLLFHLFFLFSKTSLSTFSGPRSLYPAPDVDITVACGFTGVRENIDNFRTWKGDVDDSSYTPSNVSDSTPAITSTDDRNDMPYKNVRLSRSPFTYTFTVTPGPIFIRLYFLPETYSGFPRSKGFVTVQTQGFTLLRNFSAALTADYSSDSVLKREFCINVQTKKLEIAFIPSSPDSYAFVNGIELVSMPPNLYCVGNSTALELYHRLNIGGGEIPEREDSGMYRLWAKSDLGKEDSSSNTLWGNPNDKRVPNPTNACSAGNPSGVCGRNTKHVSGKNPKDPGSGMYQPLGGEGGREDSSLKPPTNELGTGISISNFTFPINYSYEMPAAPVEVYRSAVSMGPNRTDNMLRNLTLSLPVHGGFSYLVRLHFCQFPYFLFDVKEIKRKFTVYINKKKMVNGTVDLVTLGFPMYKDYVVKVDMDESEITRNMSIDLEPLESVTNDAILNGIEVLKLSNNGSLAVPNPPGPPASVVPPGVTPTSDDNFGAMKKTIAVVAGSVGYVILLSVIGFVVLRKLNKKKSKKKKKKKKTTENLLPEQRCKCFSFEEILEATDFFSKEREIGEGGFGVVYKGIFEDEDLTVAIKRLNPDSCQGVQEFKTEIELLSKLRHYHLVSLIGYCIEGKEMLLVYEFMQNGTFRDHLYGTPNGNQPLPWKKRLEICHGAARGLHYLHSGVEQTIIHRDVKTTNILLDENMVAKVSDFGMSKMAPNDTAVSTAVKGTPGYLDPEYYRRYQVTEKSDVYSFGVVLFEVLCARKPLDPSCGDREMKLTLWAQRCIEEGAVYQIIDRNLKGRISPECLKQYLELATSCIANKGSDRPTMEMVEKKIKRIMELQEEEDAKEMKKHRNGAFSYPEEPLPPAMVASMRSQTYKSHVANVLSGSDFTASTMTSQHTGESNTTSGIDLSDSMKC